MSDAFYEALAVWSQVAGSVAFIVVLVYIFNRFVGPAVAASEQRKNAELADAERRRDAAKELVVVTRSEVASADDEVRAIGERAARDAAHERARIVGEAKAEGERVVRNAEGELGRARGAARERLRDELVERALQIARDAASRVDDGTNARVVSGVMDRIDHEDAS
jgi:F0F1-type ATP synthase membrane subunit b/b'